MQKSIFRVMISIVGVNQLQTISKCEVIVPSKEIRTDQSVYCHLPSSVAMSYGRRLKEHFADTSGGNAFKET